MERDPAIERAPGKGVDAEHPWLGLSAFSFETQEYFFGRTEEVREIFLRVRDNPLTILFGQSGLGKTSLLGAGLLPKLLVEGYRPILIRLEYEDDSPPLLAQVKKAIAENYGERIPGWSVDESVSDCSLWEMFHRRDWGPSDIDTRPPVIIFDQMEEIFTLADSDDPSVAIDIERFFNRLADLVENRPPDSLVEEFKKDRKLASEFDYKESPVRIVLTLREDFLSSLESWKPVMPSLMQNRMALLRLNGLQALEAVVRPGRMGAAELVSDEVGAKIVRFVAQKPEETSHEEIRAVPPLLSLLCHELNAARLAADPPGERITSELVDSQGSDILQNFYRRSFAGLDPAVRHFVEDRMLTTSGHRTPVAREDAEAELKAAGVASVGEAIDRLIAGRLLSAEDKGGLQRLEITHDVIAPLALASRTERRDREEVEARERELEEAREREKASQRARRRLRITASIMTVLALASVAGAIYGRIGMRRAEEANLKQMELHREQIELLKAASRSDHARAEQMFREGEEAEGLAYLARSLQFDSQNRIAAGHALSALQYSSVPYWRFQLGVRHEMGVAEAAFSPDGKLVASGSNDGLVRVWDPESGESFFEPLAHSVGVTHVRFGPGQKRLVVVTSDFKAQIYNAETGEKVGKSLSHEGLIHSIAFSPDGNLIATASADYSARLWRVETGESVGEPLKHGDEVRAADFSPDGTLLVTGSSDYTAQIWQVDSGLPDEEPIRHGDEVRSVSFSPNGEWVVTASHDHNVRIVDLESRLLLIAPLNHEVEVEYAQFSPDNGRVVSVSTDDTVRVWNIESGQLQGAPALHDDRIKSVRFSPDGRRFLTASSDNTARVWDVETGRQIGTALEHSDSVTSAVFSPDGSRVATASADHTVKIWRRESGQPRGLVFWHDDEVLDAVFSPDGTRAATASDDNTARIWDLRTGLAMGPPLEHDYDVVSIAFSLSGDRVLTGSNDNMAHLWDVETGKPVGAPLQHSDYVRHVAFSPDGERAVTASWDRTARLWSVATGQPMGDPMRHEDKVDFAAFSPDGNRVVTASADYTARIWDADSGSGVGNPLRHEAEVVHAAFSPDGRRVATASADGTARIWDAESGDEIGESLRHTQKVEKVAFSPDGALLVSAGTSGLAQIWEVETGKRFGRPFFHNEPVIESTFSPDGEFLITAAGRSVRVWHIESGRPVIQPLQHLDRVATAAISSDGTRVLTASADRSARVWALTIPADPAPEWFYETTVPDLSRKQIERDGAARILPLEEQISNSGRQAPNWQRPRIPRKTSSIGE